MRLEHQFGGYVRYISYHHYYYYYYYYYYFFSKFPLCINQFAPGIFLVFPDTHTSLFLAKNLKKILAINNFFCQ